MKRSVQTYFKALGTRVEREWRAANYDDERFAEIADRALRDEPSHRGAAPENVLRWVLGDDELPQQFQPGGTFGQPPITVFRGARFVVDVLFWLDGTTAVHSHSFSGAFQVMAGSSVHGVWHFKEDEAITSCFSVGELRLHAMELLTPGDTRRIISGTRFIHSLFHLDRPSVSVVVRTMLDRASATQHEYSPPHFQNVSFHEGVRDNLRMASLDVLGALDPKNQLKELERSVTELDAHTTFRVLFGLAHLREHRRDDFQGLVAIARKRHGSIVDRFGPVFDESDRQTKIIDRRKHIWNPDHRFFLALLLNAPDRKVVLELVGKRCPKQPAIDTIVRWVSEMAAQPSPIDPEEPNALGIPFDESLLDVFRLSLQSKTPEALIKALRREYSPEDVREQEPLVRAFYSAFQRAPLFRNLFRAGS